MPPFLDTSVSSGPAATDSERCAVLDIGHTHIEVAVNADTLDADIVVLRRPGLDRRLVGQVGRHRVHRIDEHGLLGFESLLALFKIGETLGHRCVLIAQLLGLSLDIRQLVGVSRCCESQNGRC